MDFVQNAWNSFDWIGRSRVIILRSFTKTFALPGVRAGFAVGDPKIISEVKRQQPPWSVNGFAEAAALAALSSYGHVEKVRSAMVESKRRLVDGLSALGLRFAEGAANFVLVNVPSAREFRWKLMREGILVRDCGSFGLPDHVRMAVPAPADVSRVLAAFDRVLQRRLVMAERA